MITLIYIVTLLLLTSFFMFEWYVTFGHFKIKEWNICKIADSLNTYNILSILLIIAWLITQLVLILQ